VFFDKGHNIIHYLDKKIPPYYAVDPEGLMSTFPAIASCLLGALTGIFIQKTTVSKNRQVLLFIAFGLGMTCLGYLWGMQIPIIKRLWTPSYVFVAGGYSMALLGAFIWLIDIRQWTGWTTPFLWIGSNSIAAYFFHGIMKLRGWAWLTVGKDHVSDGLDATLAIGELILTIAFLQYLYKKKIFIRV
jgi:predicted acyltransferase